MFPFGNLTGTSTYQNSIVNIIQVECTLSEILGARSASAFRHFFQILEYFHVYNKISWGRDPSLSTIFVSYASYVHSLKVILCHIFSATAFGCKPSHEVRCRIFLLWCHVGAQKALDFGTFCTSDFQMRDVQSVLSFRTSLINAINKTRIAIITACIQHCKEILADAKVKKTSTKNKNWEERGKKL